MSPFLASVHTIDVSSDADGAGGSTIQVGSGHDAVVVHRSKSDSDDAVFAAIPIVAISFTFIYLIVRAVMAPFTHRNKHAPPMAAGGGLSDEEVATLLKLQRTLVQMESRVESLETILIEQSRKKENYGSKL